ncbi:hypothetical protein FB45DRAFT_946481 [Roridomyces roridus]|uniref:Uncharacterized protein n=1 Tax=Roridomyces roridus TaxID=1738132 RepID=A0AAD7B395_9AGAR|nr:hypothetical protein FB45DRAFT_946481 [Roridomyces roridus]
MARWHVHGSICLYVCASTGAGENQHKRLLGSKVVCPHLAIGNGLGIGSKPYVIGRSAMYACGPPWINYDETLVSEE